VLSVSHRAGGRERCAGGRIRKDEASCWCFSYFARELAEGNVMLGMELEGLFILLSAVIVGAMNYGSG
jgi:hypothetical protein